MVIYVPCSWDSAGGKGMVFTKYMSFCLVSPQSGLRPVFLINIYRMDTKNTASRCFWSSPKITSVGVRVLSSKEMRCIQTRSTGAACQSASQFQQPANMHMNIPPLTLVPSLSSNCPLFLSLLFPPPPFPSVLRCRDPSARWCITKDTCSVDVARQIDCVLVSVRVCVYACIYSFINF